MERISYPNLGEELYRTVLPNGLTILVDPKPGFSRKLAYFATDFGGVHNVFRLDGRDVAAPSGVAHFLEHKLFDMPGGRDVTAEFAALGAVPNAFTSHDLTVYYFSCTDRFEESLNLLLEYVSTPYFTEESVAKEQGIIGQEIGMDADTPESRVFQNLMNCMYRTHPVREDVLGTVESIAQITPQTLYDCHRAFYHPGNMLLSVVGDMDPEAVARIAWERLGGITAPQVEQERQWPEEMTCPTGYMEASMEVAMPMFQIGFKAEPLGKGEEAIRMEVVADLAAEALFGESSELYSRLYEEGVIDTAFGGGFETVDGMAMLTVSGDSLEPETVRDALLTQAKILVRDGITEKEFQRMKRSAMGRRIRDLDSFNGTCFRLCAYHFSGYDYFRFPEIYKTITWTDIREFLDRVVTESRCAMSVINPLEQEETYESQ